MTRTRSSAANSFVPVVLLLGLGHLAAQEPAQAPAQESAASSLQLTPDHATVSVADREKEVAWHERVLGFKWPSGSGAPTSKSFT